MDNIERQRPEALSRKLQEINFNKLLDNDSDDIMQFVDSVLKAEALLDEDNKIKPDVHVDINLEREIYHNMTDDSTVSATPSTSINEIEMDVEQPHSSHCDESLSTEEKDTKLKIPESVSSTNQQVKTLGDCSVCFEPLAGREIASTLCGHIFCLSCLNNVAVQLKKCPTCRKKVLKSKIIRLYL